MRAVVQRVSKASVRVRRDRRRHRQGFVVLLGVTHDDGDAEADYLARKIAVCAPEDEAGKMNVGLEEAGGVVLAVSQFTLYGRCMQRAPWPSFTAAARPEEALPLYERFCEALLHRVARRGAFFRRIWRSS